MDGSMFTYSRTSAVVTATPKTGGDGAAVYENSKLNLNKIDLTFNSNQDAIDFLADVQTKSTPPGGGNLLIVTRLGK